jgi:hypothetical protein
MSLALAKPWRHTPHHPPLTLSSTLKFVLVPPLTPITTQLLPSPKQSIVPAVSVKLHLAIAQACCKADLFRCLLTKPCCKESRSLPLSVDQAPPLHFDAQSIHCCHQHSNSAPVI